MFSPEDVGLQNKDMDLRKHLLKGLSLGMLSCWRFKSSSSLWAPHSNISLGGATDVVAADQQWEPLQRHLPWALFKVSSPPSWLLPFLTNAKWHKSLVNGVDQGQGTSRLPYQFCLANWLMVVLDAERPAEVSSTLPLKPLVAAFPISDDVLTTCHKDVEPLVPHSYPEF